MKKIILLSFIILTFTLACEHESFFELERPVESPWLNLDEFERAPIGSYSNLFHGGWRTPFDDWYLYKNAVGDDVAWATPDDATWGWFRDTENQKDWLNLVFQATYEVVASVNDALAFVNEHDGNPYPKISDADKVNNLDRIVGELYFLRGFAYYMNATLYCDAYVPGGANDGQQIPLRLVRSSSYEEASNSKIGTTEEIWNQILSDFQKAYDMLPERYTSDMHASYQTGRANKFAAAFMISRTYFAMGNYSSAAEFASIVIDDNNGDYDLSEDPIEAFNKSTLDRGREVVMYAPEYDVIAKNSHLDASCFSHHFREGICSWAATHVDYTTLQRLGWMENPKTDTTITIVAKRDKRFQQLMAIREAANIPEEEQDANSYYETRATLEWRTILADKFFRGVEPANTNVPILRLAEMYLTRSVCRFKGGDLQGAANDLNVVRKRAWDESVAGESYESSDNYVTSGNITEQMISDERLIEMFMEGDRIDYLRGMKVDVPDGERAGTGSVPYTDKGFIWSIPIEEKDLNQAYK